MTSQENGSCSLYNSDVKAFSGRIIDAMFFGCSFPFSCASHICRSQLWSGRRGRDWSGWCTPRRDKRWGRIRTSLTCRHTTVGDMDSGHAFRPFIYPCGGTGAIPLPQRHITGPCRGFPQAKAPGPRRECPQARAMRPCRDALKPRLWKQRTSMPSNLGLTSSRPAIEAVGSARELPRHRVDSNGATFIRGRGPIMVERS